MIAFVEGHVLFLEASSAVIKSAGVGYLVMLSRKTLEELSPGSMAAFHIYTHVREDAFELYGFIKHQDKLIFQMLISISGIGPKLALTIVSALDAHELVQAITHKDLAKLSLIPGIGKKTAERLCLELKDKISKLDLKHESSNKQPDNLMSLAQAIKGLGYSKEQSERALAMLEQDELAHLPLEILVKKTLAYLTGNK